jgi:hypothetical protein
MSAPSPLLSVMSWADDRLNPIVVKELRQAIQSRFVVTVLLLLLVVLLTTLTLYVINTDTIGQVTANHGADLFQIFQGMLLTTCLLFVPVYVGGRLAIERASNTSDLLFVSTLRPSSIIWGKLLAGMVVTVLILSACAPFMVVTYLLRGIDPPTIMFVIGMDLLVVLAATQMAILVGAVPTSWILKALLGVFLGANFLWVLGAITTSLAWEMGSWGIGSRMGDWEFWAPVLGSVLCWLAGVGLVFFYTVALISPPPSNRALPLRVYMTCIWAVSLGVFIYLSYLYSDSGGLMVWAAFASVVLLTSLVISVSERDVIGPRLRRSVPRNLLLRIPAFFLFSGAASGLFWSVLMMILTLGGAWGIARSMEVLWGISGPGGSGAELLGAIAVAGLYLLAYVLTAVLLRRLLFKHAAAVASTSAIAIFLMALGCIVPVIIAFATNPTHWEMRGDWWLALNPLGPIFELNQSGWSGLQQRGLLISSVWSAVMILLNISWLGRQVGAFRPLNDDTDTDTSAAAEPVTAADPTHAGGPADG